MISTLVAVGVISIVGEGVSVALPSLPWIVSVSLAGVGTQPVDLQQYNQLLDVG
jgi:hypothetical protein